MPSISALIVGVMIVTYRTSSPEMAISLQSGLEGNVGIAVGNIEFCNRRIINNFQYLIKWMVFFLIPLTMITIAVS